MHAPAAVWEPEHRKRHRPEHMAPWKVPGSQLPSAVMSRISDLPVPNLPAPKLPRVGGSGMVTGSVVAIVAAGAFGVATTAQTAPESANIAASRPADDAASRGIERFAVSTSVVTGAPTTTSTTEAPTTTTVMPTTTAPPSTTTTAKPTTTTTAAPKPGNTATGGASFYDYKPGGCAHKTLPKGTKVTVTNVANNKTTTCVVNDRGPFIAGRVIDLNRDVFTQVASTSSGVFQAKISW